MPAALSNWVIFLIFTTVAGSVFAEKPTPAEGGEEKPAVEIQEKEKPEETPIRSARIIPIEGMVKKLLLTTLKRRTEQALREKVDLIVYRIKSDGGEVGAALEMSNYVFGLDKKVRTIAYVEDKAYSAAALFSLACDDLYMKPGSSIGDCQPIMMTSEGPKVIGEKMQTVLRERFRTYAEVNGYPKLLAQSMVTQEYEILSVVEKESGKKTAMRRKDWDFLGEEGQKKYTRDRILVHAEELLTLSDKEAIDLGFSDGTHETAQKMLEALGYEEKIRVDDLNQSEKVIDIFDSYSALFLIAAIFLAYLEMKTPGLGLFGSLAAICLAGFFVGKFYSGQANYLEILLFLIGVGLLALELLVFPGFGVAGLAGIACMFVALVLSMQKFTIPKTKGDYEILITSMATVSGAFLIATVMFFILLAFFPRLKLKLLPGLVHDDQQKMVLSFSKNLQGNNLMGRQGEVVTQLRPVGNAEFEGERVQVVSEGGEYVDPGKKVVVVEQEGNHILVKAVEETQGSDEEPSHNTDQVTS